MDFLTTNEHPTGYWWDYDDKNSHGYRWDVNFNWSGSESVIVIGSAKTLEGAKSIIYEHWRNEIK